MNRFPPKVHSVTGRVGLVAALVMWVFVIGVVGYVFHVNSVNVMSVGGRSFYAAACVLLLINILFGFFLLWRFERVGSGPSPRITIFSSLVSCGATLCLVLSIEAFARVFPIYDTYGLNPASQFIWPEARLPTNSLGYKDREPGEKRGPRILVLGDSYTEGAGVRRTDRFTNVLEQIYRTDLDPELEVYNAGHSGMDTLDEAKMLAATGDNINPDVIVVAYVLNDADGTGRRPRNVKPPLLEQLFLRRLDSYAFYWFYSKGRKRTPNTQQDPFLRQHRIGSAGWKLAAGSMEQIVAWADARSIPAVLIALPVFFDYGERHRSILDRVVEAARTRGFRARNTIDDYQGRLAELAIGPEDPHPGKEAHKIIAEELHRFLGRPWARSRD